MVPIQGSAAEGVGFHTALSLGWSSASGFDDKLDVEGGGGFMISLVPRYRPLAWLGIGLDLGAGSSSSKYWWKVPESNDQSSYISEYTMSETCYWAMPVISGHLPWKSFELVASGGAGYFTSEAQWRDTWNDSPWGRKYERSTWAAVKVGVAFLYSVNPSWRVGFSVSSIFNLPSEGRVCYKDNDWSMESTCLGSSRTLGPSTFWHYAASTEIKF